LSSVNSYLESPLDEVLVLSTEVSSWLLVRSPTTAGGRWHPNYAAGLVPPPPALGFDGCW